MGFLRQLVWTQRQRGQLQPRTASHVAARVEDVAVVVEGLVREVARLRGDVGPAERVARDALETAREAAAKCAELKDSALPDAVAQLERAIEEGHRSRSALADALNAMQARVREAQCSAREAEEEIGQVRRAVGEAVGLVQTEMESVQSDVRKAAGDAERAVEWAKRAMDMREGLERRIESGEEASDASPWTAVPSMLPASPALGGLLSAGREPRCLPRALQSSRAHLRSLESRVGEVDRAMRDGREAARTELMAAVADVKKAGRKDREDLTQEILTSVGRLKEEEETTRRGEWRLDLALCPPCLLVTCPPS